MQIPEYFIRTRSQLDEQIVAIYGLVNDQGTPRIIAGSRDVTHLQKVTTSLRLNVRGEFVTHIPDDDSPAHVVILMGVPRRSPTPDELRTCAGSVTRQMLDIEHIEFDLPCPSEEHVLAVLEGALLGIYEFSRYKSDQTRRMSLKTVSIVTPIEVSLDALKIVEEKVRAITLVKDLVNTPAADLTPQIFADISAELAKAAGLHTRVWEPRDLIAEGFGGIAGVGKGSANSPRLVKIVHSPMGHKRHIALVGKGITFDTGGLTLKTGSGMLGMKYDMTGAASALSVVLAAAHLNTDSKITVWLPLAENMPSGSALRPNDILTMRNGKTVEVLNTDAEGRLVLADALSAASEEHPDLIIDIATLTGASRGALGTRTVGVMGDTVAVSRLVETATNSGESMWPMPQPKELRDLLTSDVADLINGRPGNTVAGMLLAAVFLSEFVGNRPGTDSEEKIPWIHLDIAGTAENQGAPFGFTGTGPTGVGVRTLIDFISEPQ